MAWLVSGIVSSVLLGGLMMMVVTLSAQRWARISQVLADGTPVSRYDRDQWVLPLRFAA